MVQGKSKKQYICSSCGISHAKYMGKCPSCNIWGTIPIEGTEIAKKVYRIPKHSTKVKEKLKIGINEKRNLQDGLNLFYKAFWDGNPDRKCFECGKPIYSFNIWHIHHIALKSKYPELCLMQDVCVYVDLECHSKYHTSAPSEIPTKFPNIYNRFLEIEKEYGIILYT